MNRYAPMAVLCLLAVGCEPPGKPKDDVEISASAMDFPTLYRQNCSACHGVDGRDGAVRPLNDPLYLAIIPRSELQRVIENGRAGTSMPAWLIDHGGPLNARQVTTLVNGIEDTWARPTHAPVDPPAYLAGDMQGDVQAGHALFNRNCFMCHGKGAPIGPVTDPSFLALVSDQGLRTVIIAGRPDLGMPDYQRLNHGGPLTNQNVTDIASYLSSLRPAVSGGGTQ